MAHAVKPIAEGHGTVTPYLAIKGAKDAISFYEKAFGATESYRMTCPQTGIVMHAELKIGNSSVFMGEESPQHGASARTLSAARR